VEGPPYCHTKALPPVIVGLHHIMRPLTSCVVECNAVHGSPGAGASARATPLAAAIGETAVIAAKATNPSLLMMDIS
jgi:hypothetical protein